MNTARGSDYGASSVLKSLSSAVAPPPVFTSGMTSPPFPPADLLLQFDLQSPEKPVKIAPYQSGRPLLGAYLLASSDALLDPFFSYRFHGFLFLFREQCSQFHPLAFVCSHASKSSFDVNKCNASMRFSSCSVESERTRSSSSAPKIPKRW